MTVKKLLLELKEEKEFWKNEQWRQEEAGNDELRKLAFDAMCERISAISLIEILIENEKEEKRRTAQ